MPLAIDPRLLKQLQDSQNNPMSAMDVTNQDPLPQLEQMAQQAGGVQSQDLMPQQPDPSMVDQYVAQQTTAPKAPVPEDFVATAPPQATGGSSELDAYAKKFAGFQDQKNSSIDQLRNYIDKYQNAPRGTDFRPLAAWASGLTGNQALYQAAAAQAPESADDKAKKILDAQIQIAKMQGDHKAAAEFMRLKQGDQRLLQRGLENQRRERMFNLREEQAGLGQMQKYQKLLEPKAAMDSAINTFENEIGFSLNDYDEKTKTVKGKPVDLPGVSIPGYGRVSAYDEKAQELAGSAARLFNIELRDRSGTAVTTPELERLKGEFNSGRFNTEPSMLKGAKDFKKLLQKEIQRREAAFSKGTRQQYGQNLQDIQSEQNLGSSYEDMSEDQLDALLGNR